MAAAPGSLAQDAVQLLAGPVLMRMVHTRDGAAVACSVLSYGTAAERYAPLCMMMPLMTALVLPPLSACTGKNDHPLSAGGSQHLTMTPLQG